MNGIVILPDGRVDRANAAKFLGCQPKTLAEWHRLGKGPRSRLVGGRRFYDIGDLRAFADSGKGEPSSASAVASKDDDFDRYALLSDKQWRYVIALLSDDLDLNREGIAMVAPDEDGKECTVYFGLDTDGMHWTGDRAGRNLSRCFTDDEANCPDELRRAAHSLEVTKQVLLSRARILEAPRHMGLIYARSDQPQDRRSRLMDRNRSRPGPCRHRRHRSRTRP